MVTLNVALITCSILCSALASSVPRATVAAKKSSGCGIDYADLTLPVQSLDTGGKNRSYYIHLPPTYDSNSAYPIVVGFHGSQSIGLFLAFDSKLNETRYSGDKIMVYPNGEGGSWAGPSYHNGSSVEEDIQFVADVIEDVKRKYCVDEERVFGVGMSNGGGFIGTLACDPKGSSLFTGLASHSGAFYTDNNGPNNGCAPSKMVPLIEIHGASDKEVSYFGGKGEGGQLPAVPFWMDWWGARNKCVNKTETWLFNNEVMHATWTCDGREGLLQHYVIVNMGHCWADTEPNFSQATVPQGPTVIQASKIFMEFFDSVLPSSIEGGKSFGDGICLLTQCDDQIGRVDS